MYKLENDVEWTEELKDAFKHGVTKAKITFDNTEINYDNGLKDIEIEDSRYVPQLGFIGQAVAKKAVINLFSSTNAINLENKEIQIFIGADYNNQTYYINYGKFIVNASPENDSTNGTIKIVAYDYMIKFNKLYTDRISYPCTLKQLLEDICLQAEVQLGSQSFANDDFIVTDNQFEGNTLREILQNIGKCAFSWARIGQDNKLYFDFDITSNYTERFTIDEYLKDSYKKANEYYGPINKIVYAQTNIQGQEESVEDTEDIELHGEKTLVIYDNLFAYTTEKRQQLIQAGTRLLGLTYMPIQELKTIGFIYLDSNDSIEVEDFEENYVTSKVFSHIIRYNGATNDEFKTEAFSNNELKYENKNASQLQNTRAEIIVNRAEKKIYQMGEEISLLATKTNELDLTVGNNYNELKTKFDDYAPQSEVVTIQTSVEQIITDTYTKTEVDTKLVDGSVEKVSTTAGTFDENGLTIEKTNAKTKGNFNETGITVMDATSSSDEELLFAGYDTELNETIVRTKNLTVEKYLTIKDTIRQEKYINPVLGGHGIGTFIL